MFFLCLWWEPHLKTGFPCLFGLFLENNANIFYLKTGFPFFWACDGNLWKIMSISSIWKRNFRVFSGLVMGTSFENGISVSFWAFLENNANIFYFENGISVFFSGLVMGTSFENGISLFWGLWWEPLEIMPISSIWKRDFPFFGLVMGTSGK